MRKKSVVIFISIGILFLLTTLFLFPSRQSKQTELYGADYAIDKVLYDTSHDFEQQRKEESPMFCISAEYGLYEKMEDTWIYHGQLESYPLTKKELDSYTASEEGWAQKYRLRDVTDAYILHTGDEMFYLAVQTKAGDTLLGYGWEDVGERGQGASDDTSLRWLCKLENTLEQGEMNSSFFHRSLQQTVQANVDIFSFFESDHTPGFVIVGFLADATETSQNKMSDMGFAVFQSYDRRGYRLLDYHVYPNAALTENGIYCAEHPAVASLDGVPTDENAYDVILSSNKELVSVVQVLDDGRELSRQVDGPYGMTLFQWDDMADSKSVARYYYNAAGKEIVGP